MEDCEWAAGIFGDLVVAFNSYDGFTHLTFNIGRNMYFFDDVLDVMSELTIPDPAS